MDILSKIKEQREIQLHREIEEWARPYLTQAIQLLGINNRNLNTFEVSLKTTEQLLKAIPKSQREELLIVSESGYHSKEDIVYAENLGIDALLIGEALMKGEIF